MPPRPARRATPRHHPLVTDLARWAEAVDASARQHLPRLLDLVAEGAVLPVAEGSALRVLEDLATLVRVEVLTGEAAGRRGWLPSGVLRHFRVVGGRRAA